MNDPAMSLPRPSGPRLPHRRPQPAADNLLGYYAGFISRLVAYGLDTLIITVTTVTTTWFVQVTATVLQVNNFLGLSARYLPDLSRVVDFISSPNLAAVLVLVYLVVYHVFFWTFAGQTPGKALIGLRVVTLGGRRLSPLRALVRFGGYIVAAVPLFLGFVWALFDDRRQGWHDKLAGTYVIYTWAARPDERFLAHEIRQLDRLNGGPVETGARPDERPGS